MSATLGPLVRLEGISVNQLPPGGRGTATSSSAVVQNSDPNGGPGALNLKTFVTNVLTEAIPFIDGVAPKSGANSSWKKRGSPKTYSSSDAPVYLYEYIVPGTAIDKIPGMNKFTADRKDETWFCRRSTHRNASAKGTASWDEFIYSFKEHHHESEDAFTPTVIGAREALTWSTDGLQVDAHGGRWANITLKAVEMKHKIDPKPLKNRTFPVIQLAASLVSTDEFVVISIPLTDFDKSPDAEYAHDKSLVVAAYTSVERIRILPDSKEIEWIMATASNAGGVLPQWLQNIAVPGQIAHDVGMFLTWILSQRKGDGNRPVVARASTFDKSLPAAPAQSETASMVTAPPPPISKSLEEQEPPKDAKLAHKILPAAPVE